LEGAVGGGSRKRVGDAAPRGIGTAGQNRERGTEGGADAEEIKPVVGTHR
jgi:hypothetical protein